MKTKILLLIASALCFVAVYVHGLPYGYFTLLRFVVCVVTLYTAYTLYKRNNDSWWVWIFGLVAVVFNPLIPLYLKRTQWQSIDIITGLFLLFILFTPLFRKKELQ